MCVLDPNMRTPFRNWWRANWSVTTTLYSSTRVCTLEATTFYVNFFHIILSGLTVLLIAASRSRRCDRTTPWNQGTPGKSCRRSNLPGRSKATSLLHSCPNSCGTSTQRYAWWREHGQSLSLILSPLSAVGCAKSQPVASHSRPPVESPSCCLALPTPVHSIHSLCQRPNTCWTTNIDDKTAR